MVNGGQHFMALTFKSRGRMPRKRFVCKQLFYNFLLDFLHQKQPKINTATLQNLILCRLFVPNGSIAKQRLNSNKSLEKKDKIKLYLTSDLSYSCRRERGRGRQQCRLLRLHTKQGFFGFANLHIFQVNSHILLYQVADSIEFHALKTFKTLL